MMTVLPALTAATEIAASLSALLGCEFEARPDGTVTRVETKPVAKKSKKSAAKKSSAATVLAVCEAPRYTVPQLKAIAKKAGLKGFSKWNKARLVEELQAASLL